MKKAIGAKKIMKKIMTVIQTSARDVRDRHWESIFDEFRFFFVCLFLFLSLPLL